MSTLALRNQLILGLMLPIILVSLENVGSNCLTVSTGAAFFPGRPPMEVIALDDGSIKPVKPISLMNTGVKINARNGATKARGLLSMICSMLPSPFDDLLMPICSLLSLIGLRSGSPLKGIGGIKPSVGFGPSINNAQAIAQASLTPSLVEDSETVQPIETENAESVAQQEDNNNLVSSTAASSNGGQGSALNTNLNSAQLAQILDLLQKNQGAQPPKSQNPVVGPVPVQAAPSVSSSATVSDDQISTDTALNAADPLATNTAGQQPTSTVSSGVKIKPGVAPSVLKKPSWRRPKPVVGVPTSTLL